MGTEAFTVRTSSGKVKELDKLAGKLGRSRNYLVNQAIDQLLEVNAWQMKRITEGLQAADEERFVSDKEVNRVFNKYDDADS